MKKVKKNIIHVNDAHIYGLIISVLLSIFKVKYISLVAILITFLIALNYYKENDTRPSVKYVMYLSGIISAIGIIYILWNLLKIVYL